MPGVSVTTKEIPRPPVMDPEITVTFDSDGGSQSEISWENPSVIRGLRAMFGASQDELITQIVITKQGIRATFKRRST